MSDPATTEPIPVLTFCLEAQHYALLIDHVVEVAGMVELIVAPDLPPEVLGFANRHGEALPILDLRTIFLRETEAVSLSTAFIVVEANGKMCGLVIDEVLTVEYVPRTQMITHQNNQRFIDGMIRHEQQLIQIISVEVLIKHFLRDRDIENRRESS